MWLLFENFLVVQFLKRNCVILKISNNPALFIRPSIECFTYFVVLNGISCCFPLAFPWKPNPCNTLDIYCGRPTNRLFYQLIQVHDH